MRFKLNLLLVVFTLIFTGNVFAECVPSDFNGNYCPPEDSGNTTQTNITTPTDGVVDNNGSCGYYKPTEGQSSQCCAPASKDKEFFTKIFGAGDFWCMPKLLGGNCVSDLIKTLDKAFVDSKVYEKIGIDALFENGVIPVVQCKDGIPNGDGPGCTCIDSIANMCSIYLKNSQNSSELANCQSCMLGNGVYTAIGCVDFSNFGSFISKGLLTPLLSFGGLITFLLIIYAAVLIMTSSGDAEKIKKAKETLTSALIGLIFIILSISILKFIGGDLLGIFKK